MLVRFAVKTGIAAAAFYEIKHLGVWGSSYQTEKLSKEICGLTSPYVAKVKKTLDMPLLPKTGEMRFLAKHYYNAGVKNTVHFVYMLPCYAGQMMKKAKDAITQSTEPKANNPK
uniref:MICOS complex subunit MIC13 n=1 Tax=Tabanus bromius TaxID=304241 RepID=A0A0K8TQ67_TABBR